MAAEIKMAVKLIPLNQSLNCFFFQLFELYLKFILLSYFHAFFLSNEQNGGLI
jgi:hypothetical protein